MVTINLPPLPERAEDIPLFIDVFIKEFNRIHHKNVQTVSSEALAVLSRYYCPGNVRELKNSLESMVITAQGQEIKKSDIPDYILEARGPIRGPKLLPAGIPLEEAEKELIKNTLAAIQGNRTEAA